MKKLFNDTMFKEGINDSVEDSFFKQEIDLGLDEDESYSKIEVPQFRDGRSGRFLHDFMNNQSAIIDQDANRCFVMPLDRSTVFPPKSMLDVIQKIWSGFYNIDTNVVRKNMRVVTPPVSDVSTISSRIQKECEDMKIYKLEKYVSGGNIS